MTTKSKLKLIIQKPIEKSVKNGCGRRGCYITLLPTYIRKENLEEYKKAS